MNRIDREFIILDWLDGRVTDEQLRTKIQEHILLQGLTRECI